MITIDLGAVVQNHLSGNFVASCSRNWLNNACGILEEYDIWWGGMK